MNINELRAAIKQSMTDNIEAKITLAVRKNGEQLIAGTQAMALFIDDLASNAAMSLAMELGIEE